MRPKSPLLLTVIDGQLCCGARKYARYTALPAVHRRWMPFQRWGEEWGSARVQLGEKNSSKIRRRVCRSAVSMTIAGEQDTSVKTGAGTTGGRQSLRIGTMLIHVEDTKALT
jgi:hypothetical protein